MKRKFVLWAVMALVCTSVLAAQNDEKVFDSDAAGKNAAIKSRR